ncbi:MAG: hypothetical protein PWP65_1234 [Clostridia bacterium]|nr:hypothetical protein [Clostridia bacterium]
MIVVLDANVLVSGLLKPYSNAGAIIRLVAVGSLQVAYDARIASEYQEVLARPKFGFSPRDIRHFLAQLKSEGMLVAAPPLSIPLPDSDDAPFLEVAATARCPLVTGNTKHYPVEARKDVQILTPAEFIRLLAR